MARSTVAIVLGIVMLFVGYHALGLQSQNVKPDMANSTNFTTDAYNTTNAVFEGTAQAITPAMTWFGMAAIVLLAGAYLVFMGSGGR